MATDSSDSSNSNDSPTAWFCVLETAIRRGNRKQEMQARGELARLGVFVTVDARSVLIRAKANNGKRQAGAS